MSQANDINEDNSQTLEYNEILRLHDEIFNYQQALEIAHSESHKYRLIIDQQNRILTENLHHLEIIKKSSWWRLGERLSHLFTRPRPKSHEFSAAAVDISATPTQKRISLDSPKDPVILLPVEYAPPNLTTAPSIGVMLHLFYVEQALEFKNLLKNIPWEFSLYISTDTQEKKKIIEILYQDWDAGPCNVCAFPNRGRDIAPKFVGFSAAHTRHDYVLHLQSKSSPYGMQFRSWRDELLSALVGSPYIVESIFELFAKNPSLGMVAPRKYFYARPQMTWGPNLAKCHDLAQRFGVTIDAQSPLDFAAGSMFWARAQALRPLLELGLNFTDFETENNAPDGNLCHAIERLTFYAAEAAGYYGIHVHPGARFKRQDYETPIRIQNADTCNETLMNARILLTQQTGSIA